MAATILVAALVSTQPATAGPCDEVPAPSFERVEGGGRVREIPIDGRRVLVLLPPGYDDGHARYPVVYLLQGGGHSPDATYLINTDLVAFTERPETPSAIVVMPDAWYGTFWVDWRDGSYGDETWFVDALVPTIDATFRTRAGRAHRAIAGFSAGGFGALYLAARHPDVFAAVAGLDAVADAADPYYTLVFLGISTSRPICDGRTGTPTGMFGDPVSDRLWWEGANPPSLAANLRGTALSLYVGNGTPCDQDDVEDATAWFGSQSVFVYPTNERFHTALADAAVAHTYAPRCGVHSYRHLEEQLHAWWPAMFAAFGTPAPGVFDHRSADESFAVWGWSFVADPGRAPEFLDVSDASCDGVGLRGSGLTTVTTASCFEPGSTVRVDGVGHVADGEGQVSFSVDLGEPHRFQQFTPAARALEAAGGYWTSRVVRFGVGEG